MDWNSFQKAAASCAEAWPPNLSCVAVFTAVTNSEFVSSGARGLGWLAPQSFHALIISCVGSGSVIPSATTTAALRAVGRRLIGLLLFGHLLLHARHIGPHLLIHLLDDARVNRGRLVVE